MFENIRKAIEDNRIRETEKIFDSINHNDSELERYSTEDKWNKYKAVKLSREKAVSIAANRAAREINNRAARANRKLDAAEAADPVNYISVFVEWKRNATWGNNPVATVNTKYDTATGRASGCGYDKLSAAVAQAFNQIPGIMRELYTLKEKGLAAGTSDFSVTACTGIDNRNICGYGSGYSVVPYFEGGVGVDCFWDILEKCGFKVYADRSGKHTDYFFLERTAQGNV